jgi:hypothetical protein
MSDAAIPIRAVDPAHAVHRPRQPYDAPYRAFLATSLALAVGGGFLLAVLLPLARALEWDWGARWDPLAQAHGQLQLVGFTGLFTAGMALRLMPRFSGRQLAFPRVIPWIIAMLAASLVLRAAVQPAGDSVARDVLLLLSATLLCAGALAFASVIWRTVLHPESRAEATAVFFSLGSLGFVAASGLNLAVVIEMVRDSLATAPPAKGSAIVTLLEYGFILLFLGGVGLRAVPNLVGRPRPERSARAVAFVLGSGVAIHAAALLYAAYAEEADAAVMRVSDAGLFVAALGFLGIAWLSGVFRQSANRVAGASQLQFWFIRAAMTWLTLGALMLAWFSSRAFTEPRFVDAFAIDAVRHAVAVGVLTQMIVGMAMLVVPEFAGRRLQHPDERWIVIGMIGALNVAAALRVWPALEGIDWLESTRWWPMAIAGTLAEFVLLTFAFMFLQSWREQRPADWATPAALARRRGKREVNAP